jgi:hypothetical protein
MPEYLHHIQMKFPRWLPTLDFYTVVIYLLIAYLVFGLIVTYANHFSTTITIKEKSNYGTGRYMNNIVMDTTGKVYTVHPMYLVGDFDGISKYASLEIGKSYHVSGYGISVPFLQMFPNITQISPA